MKSIKEFGRKQISKSGEVTYNDRLLICSEFKIKRKSTGERQVIKHLSKEIGITVNKIYRFTNNRIILEDSKDLESISNFIKNNKNCW